MGLSKKNTHFLIIFVVTFSFLTPTPVIEAYDSSKIPDTVFWPKVFYMEGYVKLTGKGWIPDREVKIKVRTGSETFKTIGTSIPDNQGLIEVWVTLEGQQIYTFNKDEFENPDSRGFGTFVADDGTNGGDIGYVEVRRGSFPNLSPPNDSSGSNSGTVNGPGAEFNLEILYTKYEKRVSVLKTVYNSSQLVQIENILLTPSLIKKMENTFFSIRLKHRIINSWG